MNAAKNVLEQHEIRVAAITAIAMRQRPSLLGESGDETNWKDDPNVEKIVYASAFQA
jgi:hypothetical protein